MQILSPTPDPLDWETAWDPVSDLMSWHVLQVILMRAQVWETVLEHLNFRDYWRNNLCGGQETQMHTHMNTLAPEISSWK